MSPLNGNSNSVGSGFRGPKTNAIEGNDRHILLTSAMAFVLPTPTQQIPKRPSATDPALMTTINCGDTSKNTAQIRFNFRLGQHQRLKMYRRHIDRCDPSCRWMGGAVRSNRDRRCYCRCLRRNGNFAFINAFALTQVMNFMLNPSAIRVFPFLWLRSTARICIFVEYQSSSWASISCLPWG